VPSKHQSAAPSLEVLRYTVPTPGGTPPAAASGTSLGCYPKETSPVWGASDRLIGQEQHKTRNYKTRSLHDTNAKESPVPQLMLPPVCIATLNTNASCISSASKLYHTWYIASLTCLLLSYPLLVESALLNCRHKIPQVSPKPKAAGTSTIGCHPSGCAVEQAPPPLPPLMPLACLWCVALPQALPSLP
jgi:hypothetical protein